MNESRHHLFAGPRLTLQQRCRLRCCHLRRLLEYVRPFDGLSDRTAKARSEVELRGERLRAHFEPLRPRVRFGHLLCGLRELLMGEGQTDASGSVPCHGHILEAERVWLFRPETEAQRLKACRGMHDQQRPVAGREQLLSKIGGLDDCERLSPISLNPAATT